VSAGFSVTRDGDALPNRVAVEEHYGAMNALGELADPSAPRPYDLHTAKPVAGPASRFQLGVNAAGWPNDPSVNAAQTWLTLADEVQKTRAMPVQQTRRVELFRLGHDGTDFVLVSRGAIEHVPDRASELPPRVRKCALEAGPAIDSFLLREPDGPWGCWRDSQVWSALLEWARATKPPPRAANDAANAVALAIAGRQGFYIAAPWSLP
jgi:hypothetical protein